MLTERQRSFLEALETESKTNSIVADTTSTENSSNSTDIKKTNGTHPNCFQFDPQIQSIHASNSCHGLPTLKHKSISNKKRNTRTFHTFRINQIAVFTEMHWTRVLNVIPTSNVRHQTQYRISNLCRMITHQYMIKHALYNSDARNSSTIRYVIQCVLSYNETQLVDALRVLNVGLEYFMDLDPITRLLTQSAERVCRQDLFVTVLSRLDACIVYLQVNVLYHKRVSIYS